MTLAFIRLCSVHQISYLAGEMLLSSVLRTQSQKKRLNRKERLNSGKEKLNRGKERLTAPRTPGNGKWQG